MYFDNVGSAVLNEVLARINLNARIALCGAISIDDASAPTPGPANYPNLVPRRSRMVVFTGIDYPSREPEAFEALGRWQREGKLVQKQDIAVASKIRLERLCVCLQAKVSASNL